MNILCLRWEELTSWQCLHYVTLKHNNGGDTTTIQHHNLRGIPIYTHDNSTSTHATFRIPKVTASWTLQHGEGGFNYQMPCETLTLVL